MFSIALYALLEHETLETGMAGWAEFSSLSQVARFINLMAQLTEKLRSRLIDQLYLKDQHRGNVSTNQQNSLINLIQVYNYSIRECDSKTMKIVTECDNNNENKTC